MAATEAKESSGMMQSRASSFTESLTNITIGLLVSWAFTFWLLPLWPLPPSPGQALQISLVFFVISGARSYAIRRAFNRGAGA